MSLKITFNKESYFSYIKNSTSKETKRIQPKSIKKSFETDGCRIANKRMVKERTKYLVFFILNQKKCPTRTGYSRIRLCLSILMHKNTGRKVTLKDARDQNEGSHKKNLPVKITSTYSLKKEQNENTVNSR